MTGVLSLRGVRASVPDGDTARVLLDSIDLDVVAGEVVTITGASGSGKSTLLAVAGLLRRPDAGEVQIAGEVMSVASERVRTRARRRHVGIVYQSANLLPTLTAREQLEIVGHIEKRPRAVTRKRADDLLDELGLAARADALPAHLSGGERQRVGIARALMAQPDVLLADEPTAALDPALAVQVASMIADLTRSRQLATVIVTHDREPGRHADRQLQLDHGVLEAVGLASSLDAEDQR